MAGRLRLRPPSKMIAGLDARRCRNVSEPLSCIDAVKYRCRKCDSRAELTNYLLLNEGKNPVALAASILGLLQR